MSEYPIDRRTLLKTTGAGLAAGGMLASKTSAQADERLRWEFGTGGLVQSSPSVADETVYVGSGDGSVYAIDSATGDQEWTYETGDEVRSSPMVADGTVYIGSGDRSVYAIDAATGDQEVLYAAESWVVSSPTVVDGTVYVGSWDDSLYALEADTDGSSEDSRVHHRTLGHHDRVGTVRFDHGPANSKTVTEIVFDGSATEGAVDAYTWAFGDGTTATGETVTHDYDESGDYEVTLTVERPGGRTESTTQTIGLGSPTGTLSVSTTPSDATVLVDGDPLESSSVQLLIGQYDVSATHDAYETETESVTIAGGETTTVEFDLTDESITVGAYDPQDSTGDGLYNDFDDDGETTHDDVTAFFEHLELDAIQDKPEKFDFDGNDRLGFADVIDLLRRV